MGSVRCRGPFSAALSVLNLMFCVYLGTMWVQSYWWREYVVGWHSGRQVEFESARGAIAYTATSSPMRRPWSYLRGPIESPLWSGQGVHPPPTKRRDILGFSFTQWGTGASLAIPYWYLAFASGLLAAAPWLRWRVHGRDLAIGVVILCGAIAALSLVQQLI